MMQVQKTKEAGASSMRRTGKGGAMHRQIIGEAIIVARSVEDVTVPETQTANGSGRTEKEIW